MGLDERNYAKENPLKAFILKFPFSRIRLIYPLLIIVNAVLLIYIAYKVFFAPNGWQGDAEKKFRIEKGKSFSEIAAELKEKGFIKNALTFKIAAVLTGRQDNILARMYLLKNGASNYDLLSMLTNTDLVQNVKFRILEGYTLKKISETAEDKLGMEPAAFLKESANPDYFKELGLENKIKNLEGFLFPDTYVISLNTSERQLVRIMLDEFKKKVLADENLMSRLKSSNRDILSVITLASIVEGETYLDKEKPIIAGVYLNRIKKHMRLEADPTIQYVLPGGPKPRLLFEDLKIDSPYNTYRNYGLPPGPINNPGLEAIKAAVNPEKNNYLFFVATGEGGHKFTENFEDHKKAAQEYRKNLNSKNK